MMINFSRPYFVFFTLGDWGGYKYHDQLIMGRVANQISNYAKVTTPDFIVALGDNFYDKGVKCSTDAIWENIWRKNYINKYPIMEKIPWYSILGNHDYYGGRQSVEGEIERTEFCPNWHMPKNQYTHYDVISSTYCIFLDTCTIYPELYDETYNMMDVNESISNSLNFLESKLKEAKSLQSKWIYVYGHYHLFSNGYYTNYDIMINRVLPLLIQYNVDIYFCGHEHNFQFLTYQNEKHNLHFVINGAGTFQSKVDSYNINPKVSTVYVSNHNGFTRHFVQDNKCQIQFVNMDGVCEFDYKIKK